MDEVSKHNQAAWDRFVDEGVRWTKIAEPAEIEDARRGEPRIILTPTRPVPASWLGPLKGKNVLGLAAGGGQQGPLLAAAGALVTIADLSPRQLAQDTAAAARYGLTIRTICTPATNLSELPEGSQDLIVHPVANCFFPELAPVWRECRRVLRPGGFLLAGFNNPIAYLFDFEGANRGEFVLKYKQPFSDVTSLSAEEKARYHHAGSPLEFGHSLEEQIGGLLRAGFALADLFEDVWGDAVANPIDRYFPQFIAIKAHAV